MCVWGGWGWGGSAPPDGALWRAVSSSAPCSGVATCSLFFSTALKVNRKVKTILDRLRCRRSALHIKTEAASTGLPTPSPASFFHHRLSCRLLFTASAACNRSCPPAGPSGCSKFLRIAVHHPCLLEAPSDAPALRTSPYRPASRHHRPSSAHRSRPRSGRGNLLSRSPWQRHRDRTRRLLPRLSGRTRRLLRPRPTLARACRSFSRAAASPPACLAARRHVRLPPCAHGPLRGSCTTSTRARSSRPYGSPPSSAAAKLRRPSAPQWCGCSPATWSR